MKLENSGIPLYLQLYEDLKKKITGGEWQLDTLVPTESELMSSYGVGRETVRRAILKLVNEGFLYRQRGKGTYVCRNRTEDGMEQLVSFSSEMISRGYKPGAILLELDYKLPDQEVQDILSLPDHEPIIYMKRLRTANKLPVALEKSYLNRSIVGKIEKEKLTGSFYNYLVYDKKVQLGRISQEISSLVADEDTATLLEVKAGHPILQLSRLIYTPDHMPFFWLTFSYRGDLYTIKTRLEPR